MPFFHRFVSVSTSVAALRRPCYNLFTESLDTAGHCTKIGSNVLVTTCSSPSSSLRPHCRNNVRTPITRAHIVADPRWSARDACARKSFPDYRTQPRRYHPAHVYLTHATHRTNQAQCGHYGKTLRSHPSPSPFPLPRIHLLGQRSQVPPVTNQNRCRMPQAPLCILQVGQATQARA